MLGKNAFFAVMGLGTMLICGAAWGDVTTQALGSSNVYDLSPAMQRLAVAQTEYDHAAAVLAYNQARVQSERYSSPDFVDAQRNVRQAREALDAATQNVMAALALREDYQKAVIGREIADRAMNSVRVWSPDREALATNKMQAAEVVTRMQGAALSADPAVNDARARLVKAQQVLAASDQQVMADIASDPALAAAGSDMENARANLASAQANYQAAQIARQDAINAQQNNNGVVNGGYGWGWWGWGWPGIVAVDSGHHHR